MNKNLFQNILIAGLVCVLVTGCGNEITKLRQKAEQGDASAQCNLGYAYDSGQGVPQDNKEAVRWYRLAAAQGDATAQCNLGICYYYGKGVPQDNKEAVKWYRLAAAQGNAGAQCNLGYSYDSGQGVPQDYAEAFKWYRLAAEQGYARAQFNLGVCYYKGQGVAQDDQAAMGWFLKAATQGDEDARKMYFCVQLNGYANDGQYIPEMIFNQFHSFGRGKSVDVDSVNKAVDGGLVVRGRLNWAGGMLNPVGCTDFDLLVGKEGNFQSFSLIATTGLTKSQTAVVGGVCLAAGVVAALCSDPPPAQNPIFIQQNNTIFQQQNNTLRVNMY